MTTKDDVKTEAKQLGKDAAQKLIPKFIAWVRGRIDARRAQRQARK
jgi:hypothetical protein